MPKIVLSKLANDVSFNFYSDANDKRVNVVRKSIIIKGGAGVINKKLLITPQGVPTELTDDDFEKLQEHVTFKKYIDNSMMSVISSQNERAIDKELKNMNGATDKSAQLDKSYFESDDGFAVDGKQMAVA